jgi:hypothetical protein
VSTPCATWDGVTDLVDPTETGSGKAIDPCAVVERARRPPLGSLSPARSALRAGWYRRIGLERHAASEATTWRGRCRPLVPTKRPGTAPSVGSNDPAWAVPSVGTDGSAWNGTQRRKQPGRAATGQRRRGRCLPLVPTDRPRTARSVGSNRAGPARAVPSVGTDGSAWNGTQRRKQPGRAATGQGRRGRCLPLVPTDRPRTAGSVGSNGAGPARATAAAPQQPLLPRVRRAPTPPPPRPALPGSSPAPTTPRSPTRGP